MFKVFSGYRTRKRRGLAEAWRQAAEACGLNRLRWLPNPIGLESDLVAQSERLSVRFQITDEGQLRTRITISDEGRGAAHSLSLHREDLGTSFRKRGGFREIQIGDPDFDEVVFIEGPPTLARAVLDVETRRIVHGFLFRTGIPPSPGSGWLMTTDAVFEEGELRVVVDASSAAELGGVLREALNLLLETARRLSRPDDVAVRLAQTARDEPLADARLQDLLTLAREFPEHAATRAALRAALKDDEDEIRLRCALALEEQGRDVLLDMASDHRTAESCAARAIVAVRDGLSVERTETILSHALRTRRLLVAAAALEALGHRHAPEAISTMAHVLRQEQGELARTAAHALALSGLPAAEAPLIEALAREEPDLRIAVARALGHVGSTSAVPSLKDAGARRGEQEFDRAARQAIAEIQSRVPGASPGQLSLADASLTAGQLSLADDESGALSLSEKPPS